MVKSFHSYTSVRDGCDLPKAFLDQELISVRALVFDLAQLTCQKRFDCRNAIIRSSETFLDTS